MILEEPYKTMFADELMSEVEITAAISEKNNVVSQMEFSMIAKKG